MKDERKAGAILGYIQIILQSVIGIIYVPILLGQIGQAEFGLYQIVSSIIAYFAILETTLSATVLRHYTVYLAENNIDKMENLLYVARKLYRIISFALVVLAIPAVFSLHKFYQNSFSPNELKEMIIMFGIMIFNLIIVLNNYVYMACITAHQKYIFLKLLGIITLIIQPFAVITLIYRVPYAVMVVLVQVLLTTITAVIRFYYCKTKLNISVKKHKGLDHGLLKELWFFSAGILLTTIADQIFWKTDQIIIGKISGPSIVACYSVGVQLFNMYMSLAAGIGSVLLPTVILKVKNDGMKSTDIFFRRIGRIQFFVMGLILTGMISFGKEFINLWVGNEYMVAYNVALWLMVPYTIDIIQGTGLSILQALNKYNFRAKCMFIISLVNILLSVILILRIGMEGAAIATAIAVVIGPGIIMNIYYNNVIGLNIITFWRHMVPIICLDFIMIGLGSVINLIQIGDNWISFILHGIIFVICYVVLCYTIFLNQYERNQIQNTVKRIWRIK